MRTASEALSELGIRLRSYGTGEHNCLCPKCSHLRKPMNRKKPCLSVRIETDHALYCCHHCGWKGGVNLNKENRHGDFTRRAELAWETGDRGGNRRQVRSPYR